MFVRNSAKFTMTSRHWHELHDLARSMDNYKIFITATRYNGHYRFTDYNAKGLMYVCQFLLSKADFYHISDYNRILLHDIVWQIDTYFAMKEEVPASLVFWTDFHKNA